MSSLSGPQLYPSSGNTPKQIVIFLHGVGADGNDLISLSTEFADILPDAYFVSPNAPFPCDMAPYGYQWFSLQNREPGVMLEEVKTSAPILNKFIDEKLAEFNLEDQNLLLIGFSQGTMMSLYTSLRRKTSIAGVLGYSGALIGNDVLGEEITSRPPTCLIHGDEDMVVPFESMAKAAQCLNENEVNVSTHACLALGHGISHEGIDIGKEFIRKCFSN